MHSRGKLMTASLPLVTLSKLRNSDVGMPRRFHASPRCPSQVGAKDLTVTCEAQPFRAMLMAVQRASALLGFVGFMKARTIRVLWWLGLGVPFLGGLHCGQRQSCSAVWSELTNALDGVQESADRTCSQDSDCALLDFGVSCLPECNVRKGAVAASSVAASQAAVDAIDGKYCGEFGDQHCALPVSCATLTATLTAFCKGSQCELMFVDP